MAGEGLIASLPLSAQHRWDVRVSGSVYALNWIPLSPCGLDLCSSHLTLPLSSRVCVPQASESGTLVPVMGLRFLLARATS